TSRPSIRRRTNSANHSADAAAPARRRSGARLTRQRVEVATLWDVARSPYTQVSYRIGPGPLTPAVTALILANVVVFLVSLVMPMITAYLGLTPAAVVEGLWLWQPLTYMFVHASLTHLLLNMLMLWMFGVEIERLWGTEAFARFYVYCGL